MRKLFIIGLLILLNGCASNNRNWQIETSVLPTIHIDNDRVQIDGMRDFTWDENGNYDAKWVTREFDLTELDELELVVEPFKDSDLMAHTMLCFGFGGERVMVSVEARKEEHEEYGLLPGALNQFELIYLFGTEHDLLTVRALYRKARIFLFPVRADHDFIRALFVDLATAANDLHEHPRFYRTIQDNCTTTLVKHIDRQMDKKIGLRKETLLPAKTGRLLHKLGYMHTDLSYEEARRRYQVDDLIRQHAENPSFSELIRADQNDD